MNASTSTQSTDALDGQHLYLTGYRGSGKTTVGRLVASRLGRRCIDLDDEIETHAGRSIREIFADGGEAIFRDLETAALARVAADSAAVISLGGGAILRPENREVIAKTGIAVWLKIDADTVLQRLAGDATTAERRPSLTSLPPREEVESLLQKRQPLYQQVADHEVDAAGQSVAAIVDQIVTKFAIRDTCR
jgi:shikimate kinase